MYTHVYAGVECITFEKHSTCDYIVLYLHNIPCLCGTSTVLEGLFKEYQSSAAVLQCVEVSKQPLVCNCSGTTEPLLMLSIVLLETFLVCLWICLMWDWMGSHSLHLSKIGRHYLRWPFTSTAFRCSDNASWSLSFVTIVILPFMILVWTPVSSCFSESYFLAFGEWDMHMN